MWKRKKAGQGATPSVLAQRLGRLVHIIRERWVGYMQSKEAGMTARQKKIRLIFFIFFFAGSFTAILLETLFRPKKTNIIHIEPITVSLQREQDSRFRLSREDTINILSFRAVMDSLQQSPEGRAVLQDYFSRRPGMLDSFLILESMIK